MTRILFMVDASRSMSDIWGNGSKMGAAREVISKIVDTLGNVDHLEMALRLYSLTHIRFIACGFTIGECH